MKLRPLIATLLATFGLSQSAFAIEAPARFKSEYARCEKVVLEQHPGKIVKVELKRENGRPVFEFDVEGNEKTWDVECDARSGKSTEVEQEVAGADSPVFKEKARISLEEAKAIALKKYPGTIVETEFEIEADGSASYEFDIARKNGKEMKVEVDATSGKIVEANRELWQSGKE